MKLTEYIAYLQEFLDTEGDLELIYTVDDEGNGYNYIQFGPELAYIKTSETGFISPDEIKFEDNFEEDEDLNKSDYTKILLIN